MLTPRPYQAAAAAAVIGRWDAGDRSTLLVLPTGTGKTVVFSLLAQQRVRRRRRVLVLAHRSELLTQARAKLLECGVRAELEKAQHRAGANADVVVASVQTLKGARLARWPRDAFDLVVIDEAHHAVAAGYRAILDYFDQAQVLGVTATADRLDGKGLGEVFQSCAFRYEIRQAITEDWLCKLVARRVELAGVDLSSVHTRAGDLAGDELAAVMRQEEALHGVAVPLLSESNGRRTIAFCVDVAHAHGLAEVLNRYEPGCARALDGNASEDDRAIALADFRAGVFRVLVNCALFTEGFDEPSIECVAIARPTKSRALYTQMAGRGTRPCPERGKHDCLILDFTGTAGRHALVGPVDVLAGVDDKPMDADLRAELELILAGGVRDLDAALAEAEANVAERRDKLKATGFVDFLAKEFDPFVGAMPANTPVGLGQRSLDLAAPASEGQRTKLVKLGFVEKKLPATMTAVDASKLITALEARRDRGLCTFKQARFLSRQGYENTAGMSFGEAKRLCDRLLGNFRGPRAASEDAA